MKQFLKLLKNRNFCYLWSSQILSQLTVNLMNFLLLFILFKKTGSGVATSLLWIFYSLPAIFVGPFASAYMDMSDKKKTLTWTNFLQSLVILFFATKSDSSLFLLYFVVLVYSFLNQFYVPAEVSSLPYLVRKKDLPFANSLFFITQNASLIFGFGTAGIILNSFGIKTSFYLCAVMLFVAYLATTMLPRLKSREKVPNNFEKAITKFFKKIIEGYVFIKQNKLVFAPLMLLISMQIALAIVSVNAPFFATDIVKIPEELIGIAIIVPAGIGAGMSAFRVPKMLERGERKIKLIKSYLLSLFFILLILSIVAPLLPTVARISLSAILISFLGYNFVGITIPANTFLQEKTPGGLRGRVFGNFWFLSTIATVFPVFFSGFITEVFGVKILLVVLSFMFFTIFTYINKYGWQILNGGQ